MLEGLTRIIYPWDSRLQAWTTVATTAAAATAFLIPGAVAFSAPEEL